MRAPAIISALAAMAIAAAACSSASPTPIYIYQTPTPAPPTPIIIYVTPSPAPPTPVPTPPPASASPTSAATPKPAASTTPAPGASGPAGGCSGKASNQSFWVGTANNVPFTVYCGVVPGPWIFTSANSTYGPTGMVTATYGTTAGAIIEIQEGTFTPVSLTGCSTTATSVGNAKFGDLAGKLDSFGSGCYAVYATSGAYHYAATGSGVTQASFVSIAAALIKVPKS